MLLKKSTLYLSFNLLAVPIREVFDFPHRGCRPINLKIFTIMYTSLHIDSFSLGILAVPIRKTKRFAHKGCRPIKLKSFSCVNINIFP